MSEIRIHIEDQYVQTFLSVLQTMSYVQIEAVVAEAPNAKGPKTSDFSTATEIYLSGLPAESPLRMAVKPMRKTISVEDLVRESGYVGTDWGKISEIGLAMDIQQSTEELLAQLSA